MSWIDLDRAACESYLDTTSLGRLGFVDDVDRLTVLPVNYHWDGSRIVIRTGAGSKLAAAAQRREVAFEVDSGADGAWSVLVRGSADLMGDERGFHTLETVDVSRWIGRDRPVIIRVDPQEMTGRRLAGPA